MSSSHTERHRATAQSAPVTQSGAEYQQRSRDGRRAECQPSARQRKRQLACLEREDLGRRESLQRHEHEAYGRRYGENSLHALVAAGDLAVSLQEARSAEKAHLLVELYLDGPLLNYGEEHPSTIRRWSTSDRSCATREIVSLVALYMPVEPPWRPHR